MPRFDYFDKERLKAYFSHIEEVLRRTPVRLVAASYNKHPWPYRLQHIGEVSPASFQLSNVRILDSGFGNEDKTNEDILDGAIKYDATEVVAKDYLAVGRRCAEDAQEMTTESIREFIELHDPSKHPIAWIPLQPPYDEHFQQVRPIIEDSHLQHRYMLGGLARGEHAERRLDELLAFREVAGKDVVCHGLGWGPNDSLVKLLREEPWMLNSLDNSSPSMAVRNGDEIVDATWTKRDYQMVTGQYRDPIGGMFEMGMWLQAAQRLSKLTSDFDGPSIHPSQTQLPGVSADD